MQVSAPSGLQFNLYLWDLALLKYVIMSLFTDSRQTDVCKKKQYPKAADKDFIIKDFMASNDPRMVNVGHYDCLKWIWLPKSLENTMLNVIKLKTDPWWHELSVLGVIIFLLAIHTQC